MQQYIRTCRKESYWTLIKRSLFHCCGKEIIHPTRIVVSTFRDVAVPHDVAWDISKLDHADGYLLGLNNIIRILESCSLVRCYATTD